MIVITALVRIATSSSSSSWALGYTHTRARAGRVLLHSSGDGARSLGLGICFIYHRCPAPPPSRRGVRVSPGRHRLLSDTSRARTFKEVKPRRIASWWNDVVRELYGSFKMQIGRIRRISTNMKDKWYTRLQYRSNIDKILNYRPPDLTRI